MWSPTDSLFVRSQERGYMEVTYKNGRTYIKIPVDTPIHSIHHVPKHVQNIPFDNIARSK